MNLASISMGVSKDRLLPASLPFRFFAAATAFHILAWAMLLWGVEDLAGFSGGPGLILASLHLLTLGVLAMSAMGAAYQLLPVATGQAIGRHWPIKISFWLFAPGTLLLSLGMIDADRALLYLGSFGVGAGLLIFAWLTAGNLWRARAAMPVVTAHGWAALFALLLLFAMGLLLIGDFDNSYLASRQEIAVAHMIVAIFGFMGLLIFGFSQILVPMFTLSRALPTGPGWFELTISALAITLGAAGALSDNEAMMLAAIILGLGGAITHLWLMKIAFQTRMRKRLGLSFVLIRLSWAMLVIGLLTGLAVMANVPIANGVNLAVFVLLAGWLLTFLAGILQRIMPFLASMHTISQGGKPPLLSELTAERPLMVHALCHCGAVALCATGIILEMPLFVQLSAIAGLVGAVAFATFAAYILLRVRRGVA